MSTEILSLETGATFYLNEFWGGDDGTCHQITVTNDHRSGHGYVQLTRAKMHELCLGFLRHVASEGQKVPSESVKNRTANEIRNKGFECDDGMWECARWLQEIAAQLAELNEREATKPKPIKWKSRDYFPEP